MPMHFRDLDVSPQLEGVTSALIVPCNLCPAVTVAVREKRPFMQLFKGPFRSPPFDEHLRSLQSRLADRGVRTEIFKSRLYHQWFLCIWTHGRRAKLARRASSFDAVIVLGCESATETVRAAVEPHGCKVIEGMAASGIMNAELTFRLPCDISFENSTVVPLSG